MVLDFVEVSNALKSMKINLVAIFLNYPIHNDATGRRMFMTAFGF